MKANLFAAPTGGAVPEPMTTGGGGPAPSSAAVAVAAVQRPNTKRKRKFKRMAVDPNTSAVRTVIVYIN